MEELLGIGLIGGVLLYIGIFFASVWFSVKFQFGEESKDERGKNILNTSYSIAFPISILGWFFIFLIDEYIVNSIVEKAEVCKEDLIIEIGPGLGTLTSILLEKAGKVVCIEIDPKMIKILKIQYL